MSTQEYRVLAYCRVEDRASGVRSEKSVDLTMRTGKQGNELEEEARWRVEFKVGYEGFVFVEYLSLSIQPMLLYHLKMPWLLDDTTESK